MLTTDDLKGGPAVGQRLVLESLGQDGTHVGWMVFCPACKCGHLFDKRWTFNGDIFKPTFTPSMLVDRGVNLPRCHSYVTDGKIQFLSDCTHELAGKTVPLEPF